MLTSYPTLPAGATPFQGRRVCVTGGAGFIGSHLVEALVGAGADVAVIDDLSNGFESNLATVRDRIRFGRGSILDDAALATALEGAEVVYHEAALGSVPASLERPLVYQQVNTEGTVRVLEACRRAGVRRVVYAASSSAYGDQPVSPKVESMVPDPLSPYAVSKLAGEHFLRAYANCYGLSSVALRYFNIFGPRQRADSPYAAVIPKFADALRAGRKPVIFGDGRQTRDFTFIANVVWANMLAGAVDRPLAGQCVNIACGGSASLLELLEQMARILGAPAEAEHAPARAGDVTHSRASIDAAAALIGYSPIVGFAEGLRLTLAP
ncbi:MAG: NAD-dependent epimerase/dehydratase family protein [Phycisphaerales bacterium]|nr:NAD-dependent epimerase/dehydratase family protein [Phycisphaerales bacterium]